MMFVAAPVLQALATYLTGEYEWDVMYSVMYPIANPAQSPTNEHTNA